MVERSPQAPLPKLHRGREREGAGGAGRTLREVISRLPGHADDPAVLTLESGGFESLSYEDLWGRIGEAVALLSERALGKGDRVAIVGPDGVAGVVACLAAVDAGAVPVPIDAALDRESLAHVLGDCAPRLVLAGAADRERVENVLPNDATCLDLEELADPPPNRLGALPELRPEETAVLFYTSGTTGPPKGVPLSHANLMFELDRLTEMGLVGPGDRLLLPLPLHHVYPFVVGLLTALVYGIGIVFPRSLTGPDMQAAMREGEVTALLGVPRLYQTMVSGIDRRAESGGLAARLVYRALSRASLYAHRRLSLPLGRLLMRPVRRRVAPHLRLLASGGAKLEEDLAWRLDSFGWTVATGYGLTETSPMLSVLPPGDKTFASAGRPVPGVELRVAPDDDEEDEVGEIQARGPNVFGGYLGLPDKTAEAFTDDGWYRTEDRGRIDSSGYLHVFGRSSLFAVTEAGENISFEELEKAYAQHPMIREIGIFMRDDRLCAVAVPDRGGLRERGAEDPDAAVEAAVGKRGRDLPGHKRILDVVVSGERLARTQLGKIRRDKLKERFDGRGEGGEVEKGPIALEEMSAEDRDLLQDQAAREVWEGLAARFETVRLTPDSDVTADLGIDSLEWINVTLEIRERTGIALTEEATSRLETVRDLLREVRDASGAPWESAGDVARNPEHFLSDDQRRWLKPLGRGEIALSWILYHANRAIVRGFFRLRVEGMGALREADQVVVLPNHASYLDGFVIMAALPFGFLQRSYLAGSAELAFATPVHRVAMRLGRALPIQGQRAAFSSLALPLLALRDGASLIWFPEGGRSPDGQLRPLRPGIGILLSEHPVAAVPASIEGSHEAMPVGRAIPRPRRITVRLGRPVAVDELERQGEGEDRRQRITSAIASQMQGLRSAARA